MHKVVEETSVIQVKSLCSDDGNYRYTLSKIWDENRPRAVAIGINPSKATHLKGDNTATNVMNYLIDKGFGAMTILNLFPYRCTNPSELNKRDPSYDKNNTRYISDHCMQADMILIMWGYEKTKYCEQKEKVERLLLPYREKVHCFCDLKGNKPQHLRILSDN